MPTRRQLADALRVLSMDAIEKAKSGHPGAPLGMADMAEALWRHGFRHNPNNPQWIDRDRFVLSNGHASMLLYALLHLTGYALSIQDIRDFRQLGSKTPGHPEFGVTPGVDATTGPLGQGLAMACGMALAERLLANTFNRPDFPLIDHYTYCFCGDGCLMEGVTQEACSLAGTWRLGKLIVYYDANGISIDGKIDAWFTEDTTKRFEAMQWQVIGPIDGHNPEALDAALLAAKKDTQRPSLIVCQTHIGFGSNKEDSETSHGAPLGEESIALAKAQYGWEDPPFVIPASIQEAWDAKEAGATLEKAWNELFARYSQAYPDSAKELTRRMRGDLPETFDECCQHLLTTMLAKTDSLATRKHSQACLEAFTACMPELIGGSADLSGSVGTMTRHTETFDPVQGHGNYLYYGVREFGMSCIMNGLALHKGFIPYAGTFLSFADQAKNALRLAAMMQTHCIWVFTHDSIGVGEDGPTHQPIEQIASLRIIPGMEVWRPCDGPETALAWQCALTHTGPTSLILSRQGLPALPRDPETTAHIAKGGYILRDCQGDPQLLLIATGSEVALALEAADVLAKEGILVRVVSMPCVERFEKQNSAWRDFVLPPSVRARVAIEAGSPSYWYRYVGLDGAILGMDTFGCSGKAKDLRKHFGFTVDHVVSEALALLR
ncbi:MAG: transketolase [Desulfovibrio sp.]|nr:transketolase [Desulfovibrio sp.]